MNDRVKMAGELMTIASEIEATLDGIDIFENLGSEQVEREKKKLYSLNLLFDLKVTDIFNEITN